MARDLLPDLSLLLAVRACGRSLRFAVLHGARTAAIAYFGQFGEADYRWVFRQLLLALRGP